MIATKEQILEALEVIIDPDLDINIVKMGLIYEVEVGDDGVVDFEMTLSSPGCPHGPFILGRVISITERLEGITEAKLEIVWEPPWRLENALTREEADLLDLNWDLAKSFESD